MSVHFVSYSTKCALAMMGANKCDTYILREIHFLHNASNRCLHSLAQTLTIKSQFMLQVDRTWLHLSESCGYHTDNLGHGCFHCFGESYGQLECPRRRCLGYPSTLT